MLGHADARHVLPSRGDLRNGFATLMRGKAIPHVARLAQGSLS